MTIRKKLISSYIAIFIVPVLLFLMALTALFFLFAGKDYFINPELNKNQAEVEHEIFSHLKLMTTYSSNQLVNPEYLEEISERLSESNLFLIVRVEEDIIFRSKEINSYSFAEFLTPFGAFKKHSHDYVTIEQKPFKFEQHDFYFPDQQQGSIFLVKEASLIEQFTLKYFPWLLVMLLFILVITNGTISYLVSRDIIRPLTALKDATEKIMDGDLDFEIETNRNDEIGALSSSFEEMRDQLQKSLDLQLKYEENRKLLLSNISHDLKTPITSIKGYVEGIQDGIANSPEKFERYISTIYKKANDMDGMIDELFLYSKLDLKRIPFNFDHVNLIAYMEDCVEGLSLEFEEKGVSISFAHNGDKPIYAFADREKLMRVFSNIIINSIKYMNKENGQVVLSCEVRADVVEVVIKDNGPGIAKEAMPFIFEHFYRADASRTSQRGGSGLGLAIAKQIIQEHGGDIWVNPNVIEGTEIHFTLKRVVRT
ncbi:HAMP domain-containing histidine kinase [Cytobacillus spongiae]|jgi:histidine kinase|uniref:sensor histidine kinase n=1 Tax=Cytobacillus spongiae TaxID=2901381 RepID=UPI001F36EE0E|nr:HAMP domain-containing sensor histidine kinase [Cytobacillus spongiae]UII56325.1 HAMP domain-containing histidine kinase [Cytobacillus spongiae]